MPSPTTKEDRCRLIYTRRLDAVQEKYNLPKLDTHTKYYLALRCAAIEGEGIADYDLRVLHRLASRGFFRSLTKLRQ